jgi:hypothetical protein
MLTAPMWQMMLTAPMWQMMPTPMYSMSMNDSQNLPM